MTTPRNIPTSGAAVRGSRTGRPIMVVLDILGRRSTLRILWELRDGEPMTFRALQEACETNSSLLNTRLTELRTLELVSHEGEGYSLTPEGHGLKTALTPLTDWAHRWRAPKSKHIAP
ncbi:MAG: winged helix-turn-helix transcriptional regulator [Rhodoferax sp.]|jgi:DNA-binding HxlR family transcriptional regulator